MKTIKETLQTIYNLTEEEVTIFLSEFRKVELDKGTAFVEEGEICNKVGLIETGIVKCVYFKKGEEVIEEFLCENSFVTNYPSFLTQTPSEKEIRCIESCCIHIIDRESLMELGKNHAFVERMANRTSEQLFLRGQKRIQSLLTSSAMERYKELIAQRPDLVQRIPQYLLASYLNVQPETVSRIRKKLISENIS